MTTPDHDFLGWAPDSYEPPVWDAPEVWAHPAATDPTVPPVAAALPLQNAPVPTRPRRVPTPPQQHASTSVSPRPTGTQSAPDRAPASQSAAPRGSRQSSQLTGGLARAALGTTVLAGFMIFRVFSSGGFRNELLAIVLSIVAVVLVVTTILRARNVP